MPAPRTKYRRAQYVLEGDHIVWSPTKGRAPCTWTVLEASTMPQGFCGRTTVRYLVLSNGSSEIRVTRQLGYTFAVRTDMPDRNNDNITVSDGVRRG